MCIPSSLPPDADIPNFISWPVCPIWTIPVNEPVCAVIAPCKNTFSVNSPKPGDAFPYNNPLLSPLKSPSLTFNSVA